MDNSNSNEPIKIRVGKSYKLFFYLFKNSQAINLAEEKEYIKVYASNQFDRTFEPVSFSEENGAIKVNILDDENKYIFNTIGAYSFQIRYNKENERYIIDKPRVLVLVDNSEEESDNNNSEFTNENETIELFIRTQEKGLKGDKGEQGEQGIQGVQGEKGDKLTFADLTEQDKRELKGDKGDQGEQGIQGERGEDGANGKSALDYLNENNTEFIEKIKELLPQGGEGGTNKFIDYLFPQNNMLPNYMREEIRWKLHFILENFNIVEQGKIKMLQNEKELSNDSQADSVINSILPSDICLCFFNYSNSYLHFYPKYIKEINAMEDVYFNYYIFNNNTSNEILLRDFQWQQIPLYDTDNKIYLLIVEMASKKSILIEMDLTNIKDELKKINGYLMLFSYADFTEKNVNEADTFLVNYHFSRIVAQIGGNTDTWRPNRYVSFSVESAEAREFEYLNNSIYNNMLPE